MIYSIENKVLKVSVEDAGAQLKSVFSKTTETEYLWQGNPEFWKGRAYNIFPYVGRTYGGSYLYGGEEYSIGTHGVARYRTFRLVNRAATKLLFLLEEDESSLKEYPFRFRFYVGYEIAGAKLSVTFKVENTDRKTLIFALGGHPGINVPFDKVGAFEDYYIEFAEKSNVSWLTLSENKFMSGERSIFPLEDGVRLPLKHELFDNDAIVLGSTCRQVHLKSRSSRRYITLDYPDFKYFGLWHPEKTAAPFVCLEPWTALPSTEGKRDELETKADMQKLAANQTYKTVWSIELHE